MRLQNSIKTHHLCSKYLKIKRCKQIVKSVRKRAYLKKIKDHLRKQENKYFCDLYNFNIKMLPNLKESLLSVLRIGSSYTQQLKRDTLPESLRELILENVYIPYFYLRNLHCLESLVLHKISFMTLPYLPITLKKLQIECVCLTSDDTKVFGHLKNLTRLTLNYNNLQHFFSPNHLKFECLEFLDLSNNHMIIDCQFVYFIMTCDKLSTLYLSDNQLIIFPYMRSVSLKKLKLSNNRISSIDTLLVKSLLPNLIDVNLSNNNLERLYFLGSNMQVINLSNNKINLNKTDDLMLYNHLNTLYLSNNNFEKFPYLPSISLQYLYLSNNNISHINEQDVQSNSPNLKEIDLSFNQVEKTPFLGIKIQDLHLEGNPCVNILSLHEYLNLQSVNLNNIQLKEFPNAKLINLTFITLTFNNISDIDEDSIQRNLPNLERVYLSYNKLKKIPLLGCKITTLYLSYNEISDYDVSIFGYYKQLLILNITGNPYQNSNNALFQFQTQRQYQDCSGDSYKKKQIQYLLFIEHAKCLISSPKYKLFSIIFNEGLIQGTMQE